MPVLLRLLDQDALRSEVAEALASGKTVLLAGRCSIDYIGRSESKLGEGDRLVVLKPDGALLVHIGAGVEPVNWQPPGSLVSLEVRDGNLVLVSKRRSPPETLTIIFSSVSLAAALGLERKASRYLYLNEHELYTMIWRKPDVVEEGLVLLSSQRNTGGYYADFVGLDSEGRRVVVEVKRVKAGREAVKQTYKYMRGLGVERGLLVAPRFTEGARRLAKQLGVELKEVNVKRLWAELREEHLEKENKQKRLAS